MSKLSQRLAVLNPTPLQTASIALSGWNPDLPAHINPGEITASGVFPFSTSYLPVPDLVATSTNALTGDCLGVFGVTDASGNVFLYAGDATKLYEMASDLAWTDQSGATYAASSDPIWEFELFDNLVVATNLNDPVQSMTAGAGVSSAFADMITSTLKPKAKRVGVIRDFVVLGNTNDATDGARPNRVWWSGFRDPTDFDPDAATQCDFEDLEFGGEVTKIVGGVEYGVVFQARQIRRMTYVGSPIVFRLDAVDRQRGSPYPNSVVGHGRLIFYLSEEGFYVFDGSVSTPIGEGSVNRTFLNQFDPANRDTMTAAIDPERKLYIIAFPGTGSTGGLVNKMWAYYWPTGRWSEVPIELQRLVKAQTFGYTLDTLDTVGTDIDADFTESFDSSIWKGGRFQLAAVGTDKKLSFFAGSNLAATITTGERQIVSGRRSLINSVRPKVDGGTLTAQIGGRNRLIDTVSFDAAASLNADGECSVRNNSRYHRIRINIAAGGTWEHAEGADIDYTSTGGK